MQYLKTRVTFHYRHLVYLSETLRLQVHVFMFMNKISMSQTCLYNISYKKATTSRYRGHPAIERFHVTTSLRRETESSCHVGVRRDRSFYGDLHEMSNASNMC